MVETFDQSLQQHIRAKHVIACVMEPQPCIWPAWPWGLEKAMVIVPAISFVATANAPAMTGATVVFSDVDPLTGRMRPEDLETSLMRK